MNIVDSVKQMYDEKFPPRQPYGARVKGANGIRGNININKINKLQ